MPLNYNDDKIADDAEQYYGTRTNAVPKPPVEIGIDTENRLVYDISAVDSSRIDTSNINAMTQVSSRRDELYTMIDSMCEDTTLAAALEIYVEDVTEKNESGRIVWAESDDDKIGKYVTFLLDSFNIDKNIYKWVYCLCKYGDVYLRLFREEDVEDPIFNKSKKQLNEAIKVRVPGENEHFVFYTEMVPNPAQMFELMKFGKTAGYIETPDLYTGAAYANQDSTMYYPNIYLKYQFNEKDIKIYAATEFVHASLEDDITRAPEQVSIILADPNDYDQDEYTDVEDGHKVKNYSTNARISANGAGGATGTAVYSVRRGQSVLYDVFKTWRQLSLLENSILLNRLSKSSVTRVIGIQVGDMPKEMVQPTIQRVKQLVEQKSAINTAMNMQEYTNPGAYENSIYVPIYGDKGTITTTLIGGDTDTNVNGLSDVDYFKTKLYSGLKIPKQYLGDTDDAAGFNGGTSLAIVSSRYAKTVIRIQQVMIQLLTDLINIILLDRGFTDYINKFDLKMTPPTTQEQLDRQEQRSSQIGIIRDIMDLVSDIEDPVKKLKILKSLLSTVAIDSDLIGILQEEIDRLEKEAAPEEDETEDSGDDINMDFDVDLGGGGGSDFNSSFSESNPIADLANEVGGTESETSAEPAGETELPSMSDLGMDFTDNTGF